MRPAAPRPGMPPQRHTCGLGRAIGLWDDLSCHDGQAALYGPPGPRKRPHLGWKIDGKIIVDLDQAEEFHRERRQPQPA